tara:strand:+ start:6902 stop:7666 length:765 start_codon:yes stop_codon:yes gene_type:complete
MEKTLTYSENVAGWVSFYSFIPEMMVGMNSYFYTFKNGELYRHNSNEDRNTFYGMSYPASITSVFNPDVSIVKNFKTISIDGDNSWSCSVVTDLGSGFIDKDWFELKEGNWFAYIRRNDIGSPTISSDDLRMRSVQGLGTVSSVNSTTPSAVVLTFTFNIGTIISVGDTMYKNNAGTVVKVGDIIGTTGNTITVDTTVAGGSVPSANDFMLYIKNSIAESYGASGYYMQFEITNDSQARTEIFSISSSIFKSYP